MVPPSLAETQMYGSMLLNGAWVSSHSDVKGQNRPRQTARQNACSRLFWLHEGWREREGVEPTVPTAGPGPSDLKSVEPTGAHPLPRHWIVGNSVRRLVRVSLPPCFTTRQFCLLPRDFFHAHFNLPLFNLPIFGEGTLVGTICGACIR